MRVLFISLNLLLLAGAFYLGHSAYQKISLDQRVDKPASPKPIKQAVASRKKAPPSPANYRAIMDRNLFHTKEKPSQKSKPTRSAPLKPTTLQVKLWGTVTSGTDASYAIIEDKNKRDQNLYRVGDTIQEATVKEILREKVVLSVRGSDEVLEMEKLERRGPSPSRPQPRRQGITRSPSVRKIRLRRSQLAEAMQSEEDLAKQAKVRPHFTDGKQDGIILTGIKPNSIYRRMGLRNGDILMGIDEADISSVEDVSGVYRSLDASSTLKLKIKRRGRLTIMNYTIE